VLEAPGGPLLELPIGADVRAEAGAMYRSIFHRGALVNGYSGYWPAGFPARKALATLLPAPAALAELHVATGLELILVHFRALDLRRRAPWLAIARGETTRHDLRLIARSADDLLFRVELAPDG
jgi:hypothetical protein